jgi:hypothetical protein
MDKAAKWSTDIFLAVTVNVADDGSVNDMRINENVSAADVSSRRVSRKARKCSTCLAGPSGPHCQ